MSKKFSGYDVANNITANDSFLVARTSSNTNFRVTANTIFEYGAGASLMPIASENFAANTLLTVLDEIGDDLDTKFASANVHQLTYEERAHPANSAYTMVVGDRNKLVRFLGANTVGVDIDTTDMTAGSIFGFRVGTGSKMEIYPPAGGSLEGGRVIGDLYLDAEDVVTLVYLGSNSFFTVVDRGDRSQWTTVPLSGANNYTVQATDAWKRFDVSQVSSANNTVTFDANLMTDLPTYAEIRFDMNLNTFNNEVNGTTFVATNGGEFLSKHHIPSANNTAFQADAGDVVTFTHLGGGTFLMEVVGAPRPVLSSFPVGAIDVSTGEATIDLTLGSYFDHTLTENITGITINYAPIDKGCSVFAVLRQHATAPKTVVFPNTWLWEGGTEGVMPSTNNAVALLALTILYGNTVFATLATDWAVG